MAKDKQPRESCPKCGSTIFAKATDKSGKYYCQAKGCQHVWVPGAEALKRPDVMIKKLQTENLELAGQITSLRRENAGLKERIAELTPPVVEEKPPEAGDEIFT